MSRNFIPAALAIAMGVATGYYTFQPVFKDLQDEKARTQGSGQSLPAEQQPPALTSTPAPSPKEDGSGK
ncbi:hypothetical protein BDW62DRAFT_177859 [Aspergillus aurantiobrunneus]